ncbi:hypothetical protein NL676_016857 [Syzygium grande]|nr:hypothetical protein NL676_016857 [Syzygium grande]
MRKFFTGQGPPGICAGCPDLMTADGDPAGDASHWPRVTIQATPRCKQLKLAGTRLQGRAVNSARQILESYVAPNPFKKNEIRKFHNCHVTTPIYTAGPTEFNGPFLGFRLPRFYVSRKRLNSGLAS